jgi:cell cycle sensor histidine kinase DivJ
MAYLSSIRDTIGGLVHGSVAGDALAAARHRTFMIWHLAIGVLGFAALPFVLAGGPALHGVQMLLLAWPVTPIVAALDLSRRGNLHQAHLIFAAGLCLAVLLAAPASGGLASFAVIWLAVPLVQAAASGERATLVAVAAMVAGSVAVLLLITAAGMIAAPVALGMAAPTASLIAAIGYIAALAWRGQRIQRDVQEQGDSRAAQHMLVAEHVSDLVTQHDRDGEVVAASPAARTLLGVAPEELIGQGLFRRVQVADRPAYLDAMARAATGTAEVTAEFRLRRAPDGYIHAGAAPGFRWVEMRCSPIGQELGSRESRFAVVAVIRDIGERKSYEQTLLAGREEADRANAAKSRFLATMSHELRTPLNAIIGFAEILASEGGVPLDAGRRLEYAGLIHQSGMHLLSVVNGILDMSKIESGSFDLLREPLALAPLIGSCVKLLDLKAADGGISIAVEVPAGLPEISADPRACRQILINLLSNAVKFTKPGGRVTVGVGIDGPSAVLSVTDTGVGIAPEDVQRLGMPFFQARSAYDRQHEGTGLGLSVVKGLTELHGGRMEIASRPGVGTCVTVRLPRAGAAAESAALPDAGVTALRPPVADDQERISQRA